MSVEDNLSRCPRCYKRNTHILKNLELQVDDAYGKVPVEEFDKLRMGLEHERNSLRVMPHTFREICRVSGASEGIVTVSYKGLCDRCGVSLEFSKSYQIPGL